MSKTTKRVSHQFVTNQKGERTAVIIPIDEFENLLEDIQDLITITVAERRNEMTVDHKEVKTRLKADGYL